jgi:hypothetical protein
MSYLNMDHAGWVERSIEASRRAPTKAELRKATEEHRGWAAAPDKLNPFQVRAINILGIVAGGIYNAPIAWKTFYWTPRTLICAWHKGLGTFDFNELTTLVLLCHEARIRAYIAPLNHQHIEIMLNERAPTGDMAARHPNLDEMLADWREKFPSDHSVIYRKSAEVTA